MGYNGTCKKAGCHNEALRWDGYCNKHEAERREQDKIYADEPWAKLATQAGFRPYDTESQARRAFEFCAELISHLKAAHALGGWGAAEYGGTITGRFTADAGIVTAADGSVEHVDQEELEAASEWLDRQK